jgi:dihydrofolate reductase
MRKIFVIEFITLDGIMQAPGGPDEDTSDGFKYGGWSAPLGDEFLDKVMGEQMKGPFELLLGRKTYDIFSSYWPSHEAAWPGVNKAIKYVVSKTINNPTWENTVVIKDNVVETLRKLKSHPPAGGGPDLRVWGSGNFVQTLFKNDLVDELWLKIYPITLGSGKRLFAEGVIPAAYKLIDSKVTPSGVIVANYERAGEVKTGSYV